MITNFSEYKNLVHGPKAAKMSGDKLYWLERNISVRLSWVIYKLFPKIRPNHITGLSFLILFVVFFTTFVPAGQWSAHYTIIQLIALYIISILDKIDGELARAKDHTTQSGMYYDYTVHLLYPFVFFFIIGHYFYINVYDYKMFYTTISLGVVSIILISLRATKTLLYQEIKEKNIIIKDLIIKKNKKKGRWPFPVRILYYLTFMLYAWTLFFYILVVFISMYNLDWAFYLYRLHVIYTIIVIIYTILWHHPRKKMMQKI